MYKIRAEVQREPHDMQTALAFKKLKRSNIGRLACVMFLFVGDDDTSEWHPTHAHIILVVRRTRAGVAHDALVHGLGLGDPKRIYHAHLHLHLQHGSAHTRGHGAVHSIRISHVSHGEHGLLGGR